MMDQYAQGQGKAMSKRTPHHYSEWVFPLISSFCVIGGALWFVSLMAGPKTTARSATRSTQLAQTTAATALTLPTNFAATAATTATPSFTETKPVTIGYRKIAEESLYVTTIDLTDPQVFLGIGLAHNATKANNTKSTKGDESFTHMVRRHRAAITVNGTFFSMDHQKRVMGNMVSGGQFLKYSPWENYGTTLGLRAGNRPEMVTTRTDGKPKWQNHWFSITAGPRLLREGNISLKPKAEGFTDRNMMEGKALRVAMGYPKHARSLTLVTFLSPVTLGKAATIMRHLGCEEAMNLDGGTSVGLAQGNKILQPAGRELTNVITVYDSAHPAPQDLRQSWRAFQQGNLVAGR
jgi:Phosphodiester glycosidase